ncbi:MAG: DEAD/DEAH box helicase family protein [Fimbriimonadaceae bacterium]|nr:MAG: DEAD/DEAH box helicase family protein [Fimbriimonadaceae bacterium]
MSRQEGLFTEHLPKIKIPVATRVEAHFGKNRLFQLLFEGYEGSAESITAASGTESWTELKLPTGDLFRVYESGARSTFTHPHLRVAGSKLKWENAKLPALSPSCRQNALDSWKDAFRFFREDPGTGQPGLRPPQIGALHAIHAHWTVEDKPATIVMPTGTGKTETMLATLVSERCDRVLVIVPSVVLRDQLFGKFATLGLLKKLTNLAQSAQFPVVGLMRSSLQTATAVDELFGSANVIVAVINSVVASSPEALARIVEICSHLFIDEAHHVPARTWSQLKAQFQHKHVLQFTATPYRNDGKRVDGKVIYSFPLRKAQEQGYFKPIQYKPIYQFRPELSDEAIAEAAIKQLREDLNVGLDHVLMARAHPIERLKQILPIYSAKAADLNPVIIHSQMSQTDRKLALDSMKTGQSRVILCDNMLGEGFDYAQLKVAALHDLHKSLAITLQFTGRFTRTSLDAKLGPATMIANAALSGIGNELRDLYAQDADWNRLIQEMADQTIGSKVKKTEFSATFKPYGVDFPPENIQPKMSTVVYQTKCEEWAPKTLEKWLERAQVFAGPSISDEHRTAFYVVVEASEVEWGLAKDALDVHYALFLLHWDKERQLLFINSTDNRGFQKDLAMLVCGEDVERVQGEEIYRAVYGINRLVLFNLGLKHVTGRNVRFTMLAGSDVLEGITIAQAGTRTKTNLFAHGYEDGERATMGCSIRGRLWSYLVADDISHWVAWCKHIGNKLLDDTITIAKINDWFVVPQELSDRPRLTALSADWHDQFFIELERRTFIKIGNVECPVFDADIEIVPTEVTGPLKFAVNANGKRAVFKIKFQNKEIKFDQLEGDTAMLRIGSATSKLSDEFENYPPIIYFEAEAVLEGGLLVQPKKGSRSSFDRTKIVAWDWKGTDLKKESQGTARAADSIQYRAIQEFLSDNSWEVIFDDDGPQEVADIVCLKRQDDVLKVSLIHCKYSHGDQPGSRIDDLYEVCGQAQKAIKWRDEMEKMISRLLAREDKSLADARASRLIKGDRNRLIELRNSARLLRPDFSMWLVQPGLSKAAASSSQLELLGGTETFLHEVHQIPLHVVASA